MWVPWASECRAAQKVGRTDARPRGSGRAVRASRERGKREEHSKQHVHKRHWHVLERQLQGLHRNSAVTTGWLGSQQGAPGKSSPAKIAALQTAAGGLELLDLVRDGQSG